MRYSMNAGAYRIEFNSPDHGELKIVRDRLDGTLAGHSHHDVYVVGVVAMGHHHQSGVIRWLKS